ncbi:MAG: hypothetical protein HC827_04425 [Cyanobacteria bacterium RM1_2_2]|nr:hypothetical protein [Cyanobacteria bacterium RM1_2_2]
MDFDATIFGSGLGLGLLVALVSWINSYRTSSSARKELETLKTHLQTQLSINAKGYDELRKDVDRLKKENENLRISVSTLSNKPGRAEMKTLQIWDKAIRIMTVTSPGFASTWEMAVNEAKKDIEDTDTGVKALMRKVFPLLPQELSRNSENETNVN